MFPLPHNTAAGQVVIDLKPVAVEVLPDDADGQVEKTIAKMTQLACEDASSPYIQRDAQLAMSVGRGNPVEGVHRLVRSRMSFINDDKTAAPYAGLLHGPDDYFVEALTRPRDLSRVIEMKGGASGDCDDFSCYAASLLLALGISCAFVTVAASAASPKDYSHVYVVAYVGDVRIPLDCSHGSMAGWECPNRYGRRKEWPVGAGGIDSRTEAVIGIALVLGALWLFRQGRSLMTWLS